MKKNNSPIQQKLMRIVLITSGVVLLLTCAGFLAYELFTFKENNRQHLKSLAGVIAANSTASLAFLDKDDATETLNALRAEKSVVAAGLYDDKGKLFAWYPANISVNELPQKLQADGYVYDSRFLQGFEPVVQNQAHRVGTLYLRYDLATVYDRFERYGLIALLVVMIAFFIAYLLSRNMQKAITGPISDLAKTAGQISLNHDYTVRAKKFNDDEIGLLTDAFNKMLTQIEGQNSEITLLNQQLEEKVALRTTELEKANQELKFKSEFVETIIDSSVDVIAVFDRQLRYMVLNSSGRRIYQGEDEELVGRNLLEAFPQVENSPMHKDLIKAFEGEMVHNPAFKSRVASRVLENFYIPLKDKDGFVYNVLVIGHDISEQVKMNEKLTALNAELEKSNRDLEQFAYVASHDLQEPLRKIQTFSQFLEKNLNNPTLTRTYLSKIMSSAARMTELIKAVLNYSRLTSESTLFEQVDLNEVIENIKTDFELQIDERQAVIKHDALPIINGNALQLHQLFLNLVSNSLKFSTRRPEISITASLQSVATGSGAHSTKSQFVVLEFKDNGVGFEQQYADKLFNVFQRLHNRTEYPGTGIGLALCKKIVDNHHGSIQVESVPGEGTTFFIKLPLVVQEKFETGEVAFDLHQ